MNFISISYNGKVFCAEKCKVRVYEEGSKEYTESVSSIDLEYIVVGSESKNQERKEISDEKKKEEKSIEAEKVCASEEVHSADFCLSGSASRATATAESTEVRYTVGSVGSSELEI